MKTEQIIKTLQDHNDWRRGKGKWTESEKANYFDTISAYELGETIDAAIERLQTLEQERDEARHIANYWRNIPLEDLKWKHKFPWEKGNE